MRMWMNDNFIGFLSKSVGLGKSKCLKRNDTKVAH